MKPRSAQSAALARFAGLWKGTEIQAPSPWGQAGPAEGTIDARLDLNGLFVVLTYTQVRDGNETFRSIGLLGWDAERATYASYVVDTFGFVPEGPARGAWEGDVLTLDRTTPRGQARQRYEFEADDRLAMRIENSFDGGASWIDFMRGTYRRS